MADTDTITSHPSEPAGAGEQLAPKQALADQAASPGPQVLEHIGVEPRSVQLEGRPVTVLEDGAAAGGRRVTTAAPDNRRKSPPEWLMPAAIGAGLAVGLASLALGRRDRRRLAHRADGRDDSASFRAKIADEGTIPDVPGATV